VIKTLGSDGGGEFIGREFRDYLERQGTARNLDCARAMLFQARLPKFLWAEAVSHSVWLRNRATTSANPDGKTPLEMATGKTPVLTHLQEWGTPVWVKTLKAGKLEPRAAEGRFVGYDGESTGYRVYWPSKRSVSIERDV